MRLKNYLVEQAGRTKNLSLDEAVVIVKKNCMKAYNAYKNESSQIFRGIDESSYSCGYIDPKKGVRRSANTTNHYTLIMDNSSKWTKYPKRSQSIICSSSQRSAEVMVLYIWYYLMIKQGLVYVLKVIYGIHLAKRLNIL